MAAAPDAFAVTVANLGLFSMPLVFGSYKNEFGRQTGHDCREQQSKRREATRPGLP